MESVLEAGPERADGSSSSSSEDEEDEASRQLWTKVEAVLAVCPFSKVYHRAFLQ